MTKRLTEKQIIDIVQNFENSQKTIDVLSQEFNCTKSTVIRNLKKSLGELKYKELKSKNNVLNTKSNIKKKGEDNLNNIQIDNQSLKENLNDLNNAKENVKESECYPVDSFFEIAPLDYEIDNSSRKELSSVPISDVDFPKIVYMIVDKKIELEIKLLKDFPEWDFLPLDDLNRKTIEIFFDLKLAKRSCNKDQKVLKVPNTEVFRIAAPVLIQKGISRIVCAENLIAL